MGGLLRQDAWPDIRRRLRNRKTPTHRLLRNGQNALFAAEAASLRQSENPVRRFLGATHHRRERAPACARPVIALLILLLALPAKVPAATADLCDAAAERAARETGVPRTVLFAIARTETGRRHEGVLSPWPWAVNMEGKARWFDSHTEARAYVERHRRRGAQSFDVGCFQINHKWHGQAFDSIDQMFEPVANARYAAAFLKRLYDELGDWSKAAGAYHSRTPEHARRYQARFDRIHKSVAGGIPPSAPPPAAMLAGLARPARANLYPLLRKSESRGRRGSLVPLGSAARALVSLADGS